MAEFINTIDLLGDDAVIDSIIDRTITEFKDDQLTSVGTYAFHGCGNLTEVDLPNVTEVAAYAFNSCSALEEVELPNCTLVGSYAFADCTALKHVSCPRLVKAQGEAVFNDCTSLVELVLPSLTTLTGATIARCRSLRKVDFSVLAALNYRTFQHSSVLAILILRNTSAICTLNATDAFVNTPIASGTGYIYVPRALIEDYKAATNWSVYAAQFRALEDYTVDGTTTGELDETKI